jgi:hypothetical protein
MTMLSSFGTGALPLAAVALGTSLVGRAGAGATLTVAVGLGSLAGSLVMTVFPLRGEPDQQARRHFAAVELALIGCALAPNLPLALAGHRLQVDRGQDQAGGHPFDHAPLPVASG